MRVFSVTCLLALTVLPCAAGWNPRLAAEYLDSRQKSWFEWKPAKAAGGPCISCHTGATYLLARPALRRILGEDQPTPYETGLLAGLRSRVAATQGKEILPAFSKEPLASQAVGVESVFAALFLTLNRAGTELDPGAVAALDRMWMLQAREGPEAGAWPWFSLNLDPYEMPDSTGFGAALASLAVGAAPPEYRNRADVRERVAALDGYLARAAESQPLHNRLFVLWASAGRPEAMAPSVRRSIADEVLRKQNADGGWTMQSLGPWKEHPDAPAASGSDAYATALATFALSTAGISRSNPRFARAVKWLEGHQDPHTGSWSASSMNKRYPAGSMPEAFMRDAATAFAVLALAADEIHERL